jgi:hypothetical protein
VSNLQSKRFSQDRCTGRSCAYHWQWDFGFQIDQPRWPALDSIATAAQMTFKMVWKSTGEAISYEDASKQFRFKGTRADCRMEAQVEVPSIGFSWKSDALEKSRADFAVMGEEVNGRYYG